MKKELKISFFLKDVNYPRGIYAFKEPNIWYPVVYFKKAKHSDKKVFEYILDNYYQSFKKK